MNMRRLVFGAAICLVAATAARPALAQEEGEGEGEGDSGGEGGQERGGSSDGDGEDTPSQTQDDQPQDDASRDAASDGAPASNCSDRFIAELDAGRLAKLQATAIKKLSRAEARDLLVYYHLKGELKLNKPGGVVTDPSFDAACKVSWPTPGEQFYIDQDPLGVEYRYVEQADHRKSSFKPLGSSLNNLHPRIAVALHDLARLLKDKHDAVQIFHVGIGRGRGGAKDCHNTGRAIDFVGIKKSDGTVLTVYTDWNLATDADGKALGFTRGSYRLAGQDTDAERLFEAIYAFGVKNVNDRGSPSKIGDGSEILHPDHPSDGLRADHVNHMHLDVPE
jgi:hypothetical protein